MNFDHWRDELTIYDSESVSVNDGEIVTLWEITNKDIVFSIKKGYELIEEEIDNGKILYIIRKKNNIEKDAITIKKE